MIFIHSKLRNRLKQRTVNKLVYLKSNAHQFVQNHSRLNEYRQLDEEAVEELAEVNILSRKRSYIEISDNSSIYSSTEDELSCDSEGN